MDQCHIFWPPDVNWQTNSVNPSANQRSTQELLVEIAEAHNLTQLLEDPTRYKNTLDLTFSNNPSLIKNYTIIPGISDHCAVVIDSIIKLTYTTAKKRNVLMYKLQESTLSDDIQTNYASGACVNTLWSLFKNQLNQAIEKHIPSKQIRSNNNLPWMNTNLRKLIKKKTRLHKQAKKTNNWNKFKTFQKTCRQAFRSAEWNYINKNILEGLQNNNTKPFLALY